MAQGVQVFLAVVSEKVLHALLQYRLAHPVEAGDAAGGRGDVGGVVEIIVHVGGPGRVVIHIVQRGQQRRAVLTLIIVDVALCDGLEPCQPAGEVQEAERLRPGRAGQRPGVVGGGHRRRLGVGGGCRGGWYRLICLADIPAGMGEGGTGKGNQQRQAEGDDLHGNGSLMYWFL